MEKDISGEEISRDLKCCWKFDGAYYRFVALIYIVLYSIALAALYDIPGSLESQIEDTFSIESYEYEYLYTFYSIPNVFIGLFNGVLVDKYLGVQRASLLLSIITIMGQMILTSGAFVNTYWVMVLGRLIYGFGGESLAMISLYYCIIWFSGKEISFVFGLGLSSVRLGSSLIYSIALPLYNCFKGNNEQLGATVSISLLLGLIMVAFIIILGMETKRYGKNVNDAATKDNEIRLKDILHLPLKFWLMVLIQCFFTTSVFTLISCIQKLLMDKYNCTPEYANGIGSLFSIISAALSPVFGFIVDKLGFEIYFMLFGLSMGTISQIVLAFTMAQPMVPIVLLAISYATLFCCVLSLTPFVVKSYQVGAALGVATSITNIGLSVFNLLSGYILGSYGYKPTTLLFLVLYIAGLLSGIFLWILDKKHTGILGISANKRRLLLNDL